MIVYCDFDATLYDTDRMKSSMIELILEEVCKTGDAERNAIMKELNMLVYGRKFKNFFDIAEFVKSEYGVETDILQKMKDVILNGEKFVFEDSVPFLKRVKELGAKLVLLTYSENENIDFQTLKIYGSRLAKNFDEIIITTRKKSEIQIDYENGVFIDDNPSQLEKLFYKNPYAIYRIARPNCGYTNKEINVEIETVSSLDELKLFR